MDELALAAAVIELSREFPFRRMRGLAGMVAGQHLVRSLIIEHARVVIFLPAI
jgi:hypothetical protein